MASRECGRSSEKPRLWLITNPDPVYEVHEMTGFQSMLNHKRSSLEAQLLPDPTVSFGGCTLSTPVQQQITPIAIPERSPARLRRNTRQPKLRKRRSPELSTLREIREEQSEADLRRCFETQTLAYLNETLHIESRDWGRSSWSSSDTASDEQESPSDEHYVLAPEYVGLARLSHVFHKP